MATPQTHNEEEDVREEVGSRQPTNNKHTVKGTHTFNMSFCSAHKASVYVTVVAQLTSPPVGSAPPGVSVNNVMIS